MVTRTHTWWTGTPLRHDLGDLGLHTEEQAFTRADETAVTGFSSAMSRVTVTWEPESDLRLSLIHI